MRFLFLALGALAVAAPAHAKNDGHGHYRGHGHDKHEEKHHDKHHKKDRKHRDVVVIRDHAAPAPRGFGGGYRDCRVLYGRFVECAGTPWRQSYVTRPVVVRREVVTVAPRWLTPLPAGPAYGALFLDSNRRYCREYESVGYVDGRQRPFYGVTCFRRGDGWIYND